VKNIILHIGLPKTGTTALQKHCFSNMDQSLVAYNPRSIVGPLVEALKLLDFDMLKQTDLDLLGEIIDQQSSKFTQDHLFISLENISQRLLKFDFSKRGRFLKTLFPNATGLIVLRHQPSMLRSLYQQLINQRYILSPEEAFKEFSKTEFSENERWKESMQIDVKEWGYKELILFYRSCFGEKFHVVFFENYTENILEMGNKILELAGLPLDPKSSGSSIPRTNVALDAFEMKITLMIARSRLLLRSYAGMRSRAVQNLMDQAMRARYLFDAENSDEYLRREKDLEVPRLTHTAFDNLLIRAIQFACSRYSGRWPKRYELPQPIRVYLESESAILNSSLSEMVNASEIPKQYG